MERADEVFSGSRLLFKRASMHKLHPARLPLTRLRNVVGQEISPHLLGRFSVPDLIEGEPVEIPEALSCPAARACVPVSVNQQEIPRIVAFFD